MFFGVDSAEGIGDAVSEESGHMPAFILKLHVWTLLVL
jgi:hypothetical protein